MRINVLQIQKNLHHAQKYKIGELHEVLEH
jgi:hypothetical protein